MTTYPEDHIYQCEPRARYDARLPVSQGVYDLASKEQRKHLVVESDNLPVPPTKGKGIKPQARRTGDKGAGGMIPQVSPAMPVKSRTQASVKVSEADWQRTVIDLAKVYGWKVHAERYARTKDGRWMTPIQGDAGFPDIVLVRCRDGQRQIIFAELKSETGKVSPEQQEWLDLLGGFLWRPSDYERIKEIIR